MLRWYALTFQTPTSSVIITRMFGFLACAETVGAATKATRFSSRTDELKSGKRFTGCALSLAVKGTAAREALLAAGAANLTGKIVIDATNPIADAPPVNAVLKFFTDLTNP